MPPKNQQRQPPPIIVPSSSSKISISQSTSSTKSPSGDSANLIDLDGENSVSVSILEAFDPLLCNFDYGSTRTLSPECPGNVIVFFFKFYLTI